MLDDLTPLLGAEKGKDLVRRLEAKACEQAIPAEMELAILWALAQFGEVEIEPEWFGQGLPEAYTEALFPGQPAVVEVLSVSDGAMSGEDAMRAASQRLVDHANKVKSGSGSHLYFRFLEQNGYEGRQYFRRRMVPRKLELSARARATFETWLKADRANGDHLRLLDGELGVAVEWKAHKQHPLFNFFSSTPPECYSLTENPLYPKLEEKASQLKSPSFDGLRCLFLMDAGSTLLRRLKETDPLRRKYSGADVIRKFMHDNDGIDVICVVSVHQDFHVSFGRRDEPRWEINYGLLPGRKINLTNLERLAQVLPPPQRSGYQARSLHRQGMFKPTARGWYSGMHWGGRTVKISARLIHDLLAGRITLEHFNYVTGFKDMNPFKAKLDHGEIISAARIEHGGADEDDDLLVFEFEPDPSAAAFQVPRAKAKVDAE